MFTAIFNPQAAIQKFDYQKATGLSRFVYTNSFFVYLLLLLILFVGSAHAHPDARGMPDSVAEMEYLIQLEFEPENIKTRNRLGMIYYRQKKFKEAISQFQEVVRLSPNDFDAFDGLGLVMLKQEKINQAIDYFKEAISKNGADSMVYLHLGQAYEEIGSLLKAKDNYQTAKKTIITLTKSDPDNDSTAIIDDALIRIDKKLTLTSAENK